VTDKKTGAPKAPEPHGPAQLGEAGEHPLSILLFSWMRSELFFRSMMALLAALGAVLIALEFVLVRRSYMSLESLPGFFGVFGFFAFGLAVLSGWPLGRLMRRPDDYYDRPEKRGEEGGDDR
jgi:hypothetical protein